MNEAKGLGRTLRQLAPDAEKLLVEEHNLANELKITLDEWKLAGAPQPAPKQDEMYASPGGGQAAPPPPAAAATPTKPNAPGGKQNPATLTVDSFRERFNKYLDQLIAIRNRRKQILETVGQGVWQSPMVFAIQHDAILVMQDEITRTETWIQFAQNVRLRTDLGHRGDFPELAMLSKQLDAFLGQTGEEPLTAQMRNLFEEYRIGEGDLGS